MQQLFSHSGVPAGKRQAISPSLPNFSAHSVTERVATTSRYFMLALSLLAGCAKHLTQTGR